MSDDGLYGNMAGMSKNQLYDIMSQMKAHIMLGIVQSPQMVPNVHPMVPQNTQQSVQPLQQPNVQSAPLLPGQVGSQDQNQPLAVPLRKHQNQPSVPVSSAAVPAMSHQSQPLAGHSLQMPQQPKGHLTPQVAPASLPQSAQLPNIPSHSLPLHAPQMPIASSQLQQPLQAPGFPHMPLQPPLPPQIGPSSGPPSHPHSSCYSSLLNGHCQSVSSASCVITRDGEGTASAGHESHTRADKSPASRTKKSSATAATDVATMM